MTLDTRGQALLDLVEQDRVAQCHTIIGQAQAQAATLLAQARADARLRVREAFAEERQHAQARIAAARATLQTERRLHAQRQAAAWLARAWQRLPQALRTRWRDDAARNSWVAAAVEQAERLLPAGRWRVVYGGHWPEAEREALAERVQRDDGTALAFEVDASIDAGLRVVSGGNRLDATLAGLLADRDEIGARLLAHEAAAVHTAAHGAEAAR
jgi:hypothetical protein